MSIKTSFEIKDALNGKIEIDYEGIGISDLEKAAIYINGVLRGIFIPQ